jgi:hypothetical protein
MKDRKDQKPTRYHTSERNSTIYLGDRRKDSCFVRICVQAPKVYVEFELKKSPVAAAAAAAAVAALPAKESNSFHEYTDTNYRHLYDVGMATMLEQRRPVDGNRTAAR